MASSSNAATIGGDDDGAVIGKHDQVGAVLAAGIRFGEHHMPDGRLRRAQRITHLRHKCDEAARRDRTNRRPRVIATSQQRGQRHQRDEWNRTGKPARPRMRRRMWHVDNGNGRAAADPTTNDSSTQNTIHTYTAESWPNRCAANAVCAKHMKPAQTTITTLCQTSGAYWHFDGGSGNSSSRS